MYQILLLLLLLLMTEDDDDEEEEEKQAKTDKGLHICSPLTSVYIHPITKGHKHSKTHRSTNINRIA